MHGVSGERSFKVCAERENNIQRKYKDLSDWNSDAIYYCIEHGIMLGYSDKFGSSDVITDAQCEILKNRIIFGLTTRERYSLLNICGDSPIPISDFLNSAYNEELKNVELTGLAPEESNRQR